MTTSSERRARMLADPEPPIRPIKAPAIPPPIPANQSVRPPLLLRRPAGYVAAALVLVFGLVFVAYIGTRITMTSASVALSNGTQTASTSAEVVKAQSQ